MAARVTAILGPARSGKTGALLNRYREHLAAGKPGVGLWLAPTHRAAAAVRERLLGAALPACFQPNVLTFAQFAERVLAFGARPVKPISRLLKRRLVVNLVRDAAKRGELPHFQSIAHTPGLVDLLVGFIGEMKRLEIWPDELRDACRKRGALPQDGELVALYEAYQGRLNAQNWYDAEGRFWTARELLKDGQRRPFERLKLVIADGFTDFTRTQHEILETLARSVDELTISLPLERGNERADLFAKPRKTLTQLHARHRGLDEQWFARPNQTVWPALAHVEAELFKNPRHVRPASATAGLEIIAAAQPLDECYAIGRRIKRLLKYGDERAGSQAPVRPSDIAVVFRSLVDAPLVREVFDELGLPYAVEADELLGQSPVLIAAGRLLRLARDDWPFRELLALVQSSYFRPAWREWADENDADESPAATIEQIVRRMQVPQGRQVLLEQIERRANRTIETGERTPDDIRAAEVWQTRARRALGVLRQLAAALDDLPERAVPSRWAQALARVATETGIFQAHADDADRAAWDRMMQSVGAIDRLAQVDAAHAELDLAQFCELFGEVLAGEALPASSNDSGRVRVLTAASARALEIPYLFVAGLSEKAFPPPAGDDRLYSEAEAQRLADAGLPLVLRGERNQEEMLLFYEVITRAGRQLWLSYPSLDEKGDALLPSPYLAELEAACGGTIRTDASPDLSPVPHHDEPACPAELRVLAVHRALEEDTTLLAGLLPAHDGGAVGASIVAGLRMTHSRSRAVEFGPYEGILASDSARRSLAEQFGPDHVWSASHLEQYGACPYRFLLGRVLGLKPLEELSLETDALGRGAKLHDALLKVHQQLNEQHGGPTTPAAVGESVFARVADETLDAVLSRGGAFGPLAAALRTIDRRQLTEWLERYFAQHADYDALWKALDRPLVPAHFEVSFGLQPLGEDPLSTPRPFHLSDGTAAVLLGGRIDRIDLGEIAGREVFNVLDYKTGGAQRYSKRAVLEGEALQLTLYAMAAQDMLLAPRDAAPWLMGYWFIADQGFMVAKSVSAHTADEAGLRATELWNTLRRQTVERVFGLVRGVRHGEFPMFNRDERCTSYCEFATVCRVNQTRSLEKAWALPASN